MKMFRKKIVSVLIAMALAATMLSVPVMAAPDTAAQIGREYDKSTVLIKIGKNVPLDRINEDLKGLDSIRPATITESDLVLGFAKLSLADGVSVEYAISQLSAIPGIEYAQPNFIYKIPDNEKGLDGTASIKGEESYDGNAPTNDPLLSNGRYKDSWFLERTNAYDAWKIQKTEKKVTVAVVDSFFDLEHPDLKDNIVDAIDLSGLGFDPSTSDSSSHGSHVSGIISARANNGVGTAGVSYNAGILAVRILDQNGAAPIYDILRGLKTVIDNKDKYNVKVVNMSFGVDAPNIHSFSTHMFGPVDRGIVEAVNILYDSGILSVCAAGNGADEYGPYMMFPSDWCANALGVIALGGPNHEEKNPSSPEEGVSRVGFSNYNMPAQRTKDISAPGVGILSCSKNGEYKSYSGTSMSTPVVSGVAALIFAKDPSLTPAQVTDIIHSTATDLGPAGWDEESGFGCVNAGLALEYTSEGYYFKGASEIVAGSSITLNPAKSGTYKWTSSNPSVATVSNGRVTGVKPGVSVITAEDTKTNKKISREVSVHKVTISVPQSIEVGETLEAALDITSPDGYTWNYDVSDPSVISAKYQEYSIDEETVLDCNRIELTGLKKGNTTITLSHGSIKRTFNVTVTNDGMSNAKITGVKDRIYTGKAITQNPTVKFKGKTLKKGRDYTLKYENNINAGKATVKVVGKGKYRGSKSVNFNIKPKSASAVKIAAISAQKYTGKAIKPLPVLKFKVGSKNVKPVEGLDYTLSYSKNKNAGTATVKIKFKGNFTGNKSKTFTIKKGDNALKVKGKTYELTPADDDKANRTMPITNLVEFTNKGTGKLTYSKKSGNSKFTVNSKTGKVTVKPGISTGTYKLKIKITAKGSKNINSKSVTATAKIIIK